jgi:hypothetical protein
MIPTDGWSDNPGCILALGGGFLEAWKASSLKNTSWEGFLALRNTD